MLGEARLDSRIVNLAGDFGVDHFFLVLPLALGIAGNVAAIRNREALELKRFLAMTTFVKPSIPKPPLLNPSDHDPARFAFHALAWLRLA